MMSLSRICGKISANKLKEQYDNVATVSFNIDEPINTIFNDVDGLREISDLANCPYTDIQMVYLGYIVLLK